MEGVFEMTAEETKQMTEGTTETQAPAAPEAPKAEETAAVAPVVAPSPQQPEKMVPLAALIEERERIKEFKRQAKAYDDLRTQFETFRAQQFAAQQPQPKQIPPFEEDPLAHMQERLKQVDQVAQTQNMLLMQQARSNQIQQLRQNMDVTESSFRKDHPDYDKAVEHIANFRRQELSDLGVTDPVQVGQILAHNAIGLWSQASASGKNPPEVVYALAQRYGYKHAQAAPMVPQAEQVQQAQQKIETQQNNDLKAIAAGQAATKTLSGSGKTASESGDNLKSLLEADGPEFDKMWKEMFKNAK